MRNFNIRFTFFFLLIFSFSVLSAQQSSDTLKQAKKVTITMKNGDEFTGKIIKQDSQTITLLTENGEMNLFADKVKSINDLEYSGKFSYPNPHDTRYFFGPTGIPLKKNKGYYQNILATLNFVNYGISKNISIGGGLEFVTTLLGNPLWLLTPKIGFDLSEKIHLGGGFIMGGIAGEGSAILPYGVFTLGTSETNVSLGAGYGIIDGTVSDYPAIMISGTHRVRNGLALLTENYIIPYSKDNSVYFGIQGIRLLFRQNSFDIGAIVSSSFFNAIPALPFVGFARVF